ncbi:MAG: UDP-diphosphatase [Actinobacteria bacterium]|uniref:Undecaprenyl-diphosphatase n=1 Tax=freshwater metagenome TaxID=449393 RepID=A0A6J7I8T2_9ZZZZ|nr:UDP-diphosphatase [Actinomycetota bacterium]MSW77242.1 UDP-diphosphatase [Actinomycetota bacterium]MSX56906.1 UDP-diphosphatase [Actinomycetota bacterium]MSX92637.1 UDP-diphosphatase [Actinomycetota bacterium]MSZ83645.1 UDP-diphosphatase [Actinomycetota bacterium]
MPILHAIVLGLVQGLSEFLPISSSGHLLLVPWLFNWHDFDSKPIEKAFDVAMHLGTLIAVVGYFWKDLVVYVTKGVRLVVKREKPVDAEGRLAWLLVLSALPAGAVGAVAEGTIDQHLGTPGLIAGSMILFAVVLAWADRRAGQRALASFEKGDAMKVGAAQILALNPGTSRSGITMTAARFLGFDRDSAARASFLMAIPVTAGAVVFKMAKLVKDGVPTGLGTPMIVGIVASGMAGWVAVWGTLRLVRTRTFAPFIVYRIALGVLVFTLMATGVR